jgi:hypothetical protein
MSSLQVDVYLMTGIAVGMEDDLDKSWVYLHRDYISPNMVLSDENIILQGLDDKYVWFSVVPAEVNISTYNIFFAL